MKRKGLLSITNYLLKKEPNLKKISSLFGQQGLLVVLFSMLQSKRSKKLDSYKLLCLQRLLPQVLRKIMMAIDFETLLRVKTLQQNNRKTITDSWVLLLMRELPNLLKRSLVINQNSKVQKSILFPLMSSLYLSLLEALIISNGSKYKQ